MEGKGRAPAIVPNGSLPRGMGGENGVFCLEDSHLDIPEPLGLTVWLRSGCGGFDVKIKRKNDSDGNV